MQGRICQTCNRDMLNSEGCIERPGKRTRLREWEWLAAHPAWRDDPPFRPEERCWDCGAEPHGYHHTFCSKATCFIHEDQRIMCCDQNEKLPRKVTK